MLSTLLVLSIRVIVYGWHRPWCDRLRCSLTSVNLLARKKKRENIPVSDGKIIAELTFAFWKRLYSAEYEHQLWRTTLKRTFPNKTLKRAHVSAQLEIVYQMRNRLAHHEPVVGDRFHKLISAIGFVLQELNTKASCPPHPLEKLLAADVQQAISLQSKLESTIAPYRDKAI